MLYFDKPNMEYIYATEDTIYCGGCKKVLELENYFFIHKSYGRREFDKGCFCVNCIKDHRTRIIDEFLTARLSTMAPKTAVIVPDTPPTLKTGNISTFEAALSNKGITSDTTNTQVIDRAKVSNDPDRNKMPEFDKAKSDFNKLDDESNNEIDRKEYLERLKGSTPLVEGQDKPQIGGK